MLEHSSAVLVRRAPFHLHLSIRRENTAWTELRAACYALHTQPLKQWLHRCSTLMTIALSAKGGYLMPQRVHLKFNSVCPNSEEL